jgi:hypothetical protein
MEPDFSALNDRLRGGRLTDADFDDINVCAIGVPKKPASIHHPNFATRISWCYVMLWATLLSTPCFRVAPHQIDNSLSDGASKT